MATFRTVAFYTLGCKLNYSESASLSKQFEQLGYEAVSFDMPADVYVINTCSVTEFADRKCRQVVRRALRQSPEAEVVVIGCYAQLKPKEIAEIPGVSLVLGAAEKFRLVEHVQALQVREYAEVKASHIQAADEFQSAYSFGNRTRSFLKIQDGCDYKCSFCTIPLARGKSRSNTVEQVIADANEIAEKGAREIVLTGVNIGDFGNGTAVIEGQRPQKEAMFIDLISALDEQVDDRIARFRISSIEPNLCTDEIIHFVANSKRFVPHFHMPLQSGNNKQLQQMRRRYKRELYAERVAYIKELMPHACIGVDVIVGFPGESDADFQETYRFIENLPISYLHVFTYSERANTQAATMDETVPLHLRRQRNEKLRKLSDQKKEGFYSSHQGETRTVLVEAGAGNKKTLNGFTDNYIKVTLPYEPSLTNQLVRLQLGEWQQKQQTLMAQSLQPVS